MNEFISIGKAARMLGVHPDTLRLWEKDGKITPARTEGNHRRYPIGDIKKMQLSDRTNKWDILLSDDNVLKEWLSFYAEIDPIYAWAKDYARQHSPSPLLLYQFLLVAVLDAKVADTTSRWRQKCLDTSL